MYPATDRYFYFYFFVRLIQNIENFISLAENTSDQLDKVVSLLINVVGSMTLIGNCWGDINTSLATAKEKYTAWFVFVCDYQSTIFTQTL